MACRLERTIATQFALAAAILLAVGSASYYSLTGAMTTARRVEHTHEVLRGLERVVSLVKDAETGQRGFLLTGREEYLAPYTSALPAIDGQVAALEDMLRERPDQLRMLEGLRPPIPEKLAELRKTIDLRHDRGPEAAMAVVQGDRGKRSMDELRARVDRMREVEEAHLARLSSRSEVDSRLAIVAAVAGVMMALGLKAVAYRMIVREMTARRRTEADLSRLAA